MLARDLKDCQGKMTKRPIKTELAKAKNEKIVVDKSRSGY